MHRSDNTHHQKLKSTDILRRIFYHLNTQRRWQLCGFFLVMLATALAEVFSVASILPFLSILMDPEPLWQIPLVQVYAERIGITSSNGLILPTTFLFAGAAVLAATIRLTNLWLLFKLSSEIGSDFSCEAYRKTIYQPYSVHVQRNSSAIITAISSQITSLVSVIYSTLQITTASIVSIGLVIALIAVDRNVALIAIGIFGSAYSLLAVATKRRLLSNSLVIANSKKEQIKVLQEGLGSIRDVLLDGSQKTYLGIYRKWDRTMRARTANSYFLGNFPRYVLEAMGLMIIALLAMVLIMQGDRNAGTTIPLLGTLALGAQRLLPALQQIYGGTSDIRARVDDLKDVLALLDQKIPEQAQFSYVQPLEFVQSVLLKNISFSYDQRRAPLVLSDLQLEINKGDRIGLIGETGSGKSTLIDLLMGLLEPTEGQILIDGQNLYDPTHPELLARWRASIAHVPQSIYLADTSIAENIAFGIPKDQIDKKKVWHAAEQAQIAGFIHGLPEGEETFVGERGIRLSGGQRQRIGIARALYRNAKVLVFDEATSALDNETEKAVINSIAALNSELTLITIAHRLTSLSSCNYVYELKSNKLILSQ